MYYFSVFTQIVLRHEFILKKEIFEFKSTMFAKLFGVKAPFSSLLNSLSEPKTVSTDKRMSGPRERDESVSVSGELSRHKDRRGGCLYQRISYICARSEHVLKSSI